jgi:chemotaxis regulatin CheY-phosphate phosphatase CheZ
MARELPLNDDLGSEAFRKLLQEWNDFLDATAGAADFATFKALAQDYKVDLDKVPPRNKNYKP